MGTARVTNSPTFPWHAGFEVMPFDVASVSGFDAQLKARLTAARDDIQRVEVRPCGAPEN